MYHILETGQILGMLYMFASLSNGFCYTRGRQNVAGLLTHRGIYLENVIKIWMIFVVGE